MKKAKYFSLFANCIPVCGAKNASIYDLQNNELFIVPLDLIGAINRIKTLPFEEYQNHFDKESISILNDMISFLEENDLGFWSDNPEWFTPISPEWDFPALITNAIIEIDNNFIFAKKTINQLDSLNCKAVELRLIGNYSQKEIEQVVNFTKNSGIQYLKCTIQHLEDENSVDWYSIIKENPRIHFVDIFNSESEKVIQIDALRTVTYFEKEFTNLCCGVINKKYFSVNIPNYTESLHHNSCLNRKISIDAEGNIKNCPSMSESFGNIEDTTLTEAIKQPDFKKYWNINKDKIHVCKDCEFRYICTDCRAYVEDPEDMLSKPLKCGYNPYTGEWSEWSSNPLKEKAINYYGMQDLVAETLQEI